MTRKPKDLSPQQRRTLRALSIFRFLTVSQLMKLEISANRDALGNKTIRTLRARKLLETRSFGIGKADVHCLTKAGVAELAEHYQAPLSAFPYPSGGARFSDNYYNHRLAQIDFNIGLQLWAHSRGDAELHTADMDFVGRGSYRKGNFIPSTQVSLDNDPKPIVPDGIFHLSLESGHQLLYVLEVHKTTQTTAATRQLKRYLQALDQGVLSDKYHLQTAPFLCSVHSLDNVYRGVKNNLLADPDFAGFKPLFLFNRVDQLKSDFSSGWHFADDEPANPFPKAQSPVPSKLLDDFDV